MTSCLYGKKESSPTLEITGADPAGIQGMLHENYVFLELRRRVERLKEIALETPAFATYKGGEDRENAFKECLQK